MNYVKTKNNINPKDTTLWWGLNTNELCTKLKTDIQNGLTLQEVKNRLEKYGLNQLPEQKRISAYKIFLRQFSNFIIWVLIVAAIIALIVGEVIDASAIGFIILLNAILGFVQEYQAEKSLTSLRKLSTPTSKVIRDGQLQGILSEELVPGDLVLLEAGDNIPADGRVVQSVQLATQEAILTGESLPVTKNIKTLEEKKLSLGDRKNFVFQGTITVAGKGYFVVTETGSSTELGKIASLLRVGTEEKTPLQKNLEKLGHKLVLMCLLIVVAVFLLGLTRGYTFISILLIALSLAVAAIPEGLPAVVTIALSIGVQRMVKRNVLIRRLPSIETLGCASVICTDKTGTLTKNEMTVSKIWVNEKFINVTGTGYAPIGQFEDDNKILNPKDISELMLALRISMLCNNASLQKAEDKWQVVGDPTEGALLVAGAKAGLKKEFLEKENPVIQEFPFTSERKRMSVLRKSNGQNIVFVKGAPDVILNLSGTILVNGSKIPLNEELKRKMIEANESLASQALRVLGVALREVSDGETGCETLEEKLTFVGLLGMLDPPRPEAKEAITTCKKSGIKTVMITGDHKETAISVANQIGLIEKDSISLNGTELDELSDNDLKDIVRKVSVYARVSAEHKLRIVKAWKELGEVVAMTGDGVNDAPALKKADIGVAMGITGTDVTKEAADMIVTDDNFASIVNAIEEGRGIYDNIIKFINYLLSSNIAELLVIVAGVAFAFTDPQGHPFVSLTAIQLLWMNLVTDGFPAIALAMDPIDPTAMNKPPRKSSEPILSLQFATQLIIISLLIAIGTLTACHSRLSESTPLAHTMAFTTMILLEFVRVQVIRSQYKIGIFSNPWLIISLSFSLLLQLAVIYLPPLQKIFKTVSLGMSEWMIILVIVLVVWLFCIGINMILRGSKYFIVKDEVA
ncbi:MAG: cation-translocating P-type ATPase [Candidatus Melainabacteria bacterium]|nr:cation-translocating P-type ATPase [Candidatus Melainabacteria bacterium]